MRVVPQFGTPTRMASYGGRGWTLHRGVEIDLPDPLAETLIRQGTAVAAGAAPAAPPAEAESPEPDDED